jgi:hypothetical protein
MDYLLYIEHAAEHLQFFMWFRGYVQRFDALTSGEKALSPEWTPKNQKDALEEWKKMRAVVQKEQPSTAANEVLKGTIFSKDGPAARAGVPYAGFGSGNPFVTPPATSHGRPSQTSEDIPMPTSSGRVPQGGTPTQWEASATRLPTSNSFSDKADSHGSKNTASSVAHDAFEKAGLSQPCECFIYSAAHHKLTSLQLPFNPFAKRLSMSSKPTSPNSLHASSISLLGNERPYSKLSKQPHTHQPSPASLPMSRLFSATSSIQTSSDGPSVTATDRELFSPVL